MKKMVLFSIILLFVFIIFIGCQGVQRFPSDEFETTSFSILDGNFDFLDSMDIFPDRLIVGYEDRSAVDELIDALDAEILVEIPQIKVVGLKLKEDLKTTLKKFKGLKLNGIRYIEPSYKRYLIEPIKNDISTIPSELGNGASDPYYQHQWALRVLNAESAWTKATGNGVIVAVSDTPIDGQHPDLMGQFVTGYDPASDTEIPPDTDYEDPNNSGDDHGTHVAGIIAAKKDNNEGVVGLAYNAKIMSIVIFKAIPGSMYSYYYVGDEFAAKGIIWAVDHGAKAINASWGGWGYSQTLKEAVDYALEHNVAFVAAAGNDTTDQNLHYPSAYPGVIAVGASNARDDIASFSSKGEYLSVSAPGENVLSCIPRGSAEADGVYGKPYAYWGGTSMATPYVSALIALLFEKYPDATVYQIRKLIENTAKDIEDPGYDTKSGYGRIDPVSALAEANPSILGELPEYEGANLTVEAKSANRPDWKLPWVYVSLIRNDGPDYYALTDVDGIAKFRWIDGGDYQVYVGGPTWYYSFFNFIFGATPTNNLFLFEELSTQTAVTLESSKTITVNFDSTGGVIISSTVPGNYTFYAYNLMTNATEVEVPFTKDLNYTFPDNLSGKYVYKIRASVSEDFTLTATVVVNDEEINWFKDDYSAGGWIIYMPVEWITLF